MKHGYKYNEISLQISNHLATNKAISVKELSSIANISYDSALYVLADKVSKGTMQLFKVGKTNYYCKQIASNLVANSITTEHLSIEFASTLTVEKPYTPKMLNLNHDAIKAWELDSEMSLRTECSDFYALYNYMIDHENDSYARSMFNYKLNNLADQFSRYLDMAIGGELRHCHNLALYFKGVTTKLSKQNGRNCAWNGWKLIRKSQEIEALERAEHCFRTGKWSSCYGGPKWGNCVSVLLRYLKGEDSPTTFVDTVWSLQHNSTYVLDKVWNVNGLGHILDLKFEGNIKELLKYCSKEVKELYGNKM